MMPPQVVYLNIMPATVELHALRRSRVSGAGLGAWERVSPCRDHVEHGPQPDRGGACFDRELDRVPRAGGRVSCPAAAHRVTTGGRFSKGEACDSIINSEVDVVAHTATGVLLLTLAIVQLLHSCVPWIRQRD